MYSSEIKFEKQVKSSLLFIAARMKVLKPAKPQTKRVASWKKKQLEFWDKVTPWAKVA